MAAPAPAPINTADPTVADILAAILRTPNSVSSATGTKANHFYSGTTPDTIIDATAILRTIKNMFAQQGPVDANGVRMNLPWNGCLKQQNVILALRAIGAYEPPLHAVINVGQTTGYSGETLRNMKNRINGVKMTLVKSMVALNAQAAGNAAVQQVAAPIAAAAAAATQQAQQVAQQAAAANQQAQNVGAASNAVQQATAAALASAYQRGYDAGEAVGLAANGKYIRTKRRTVVNRQLTSINRQLTKVKRQNVFRFVFICRSSGRYRRHHWLVNDCQ